MKTSCFSAFIYLLVLCGSHASGKLRASFYHKTCPNALSTVKAVVKEAVGEQKGIAAALLRLHFHDCFVNGCDGSVLLDDSSTIVGEKAAPPNKNSLAGFEVVDAIKSRLEELCSGVVSCADILAIAARDSVVELGGRTWKVKLGRRDSTTARGDEAKENLPSPNFNLSQLISYFSAKGLSTKDMVALSGAHTIGVATCRTFKDRIYYDSNIDPEFATSVQAKCPCSGGDYNRSPMDLQTPAGFDNNYYKNLRSQKGLFHSDQELFSGGVTDSRVIKYSKNQKRFFKDFGRAMVKMGNFKPLTDMEGEIRKNCRKPN